MNLLTITDTLSQCVNTLGGYRQVMALGVSCCMLPLSTFLYPHYTIHHVGGTNVTHCFSEYAWGYDSASYEPARHILGVFESSVGTVVSVVAECCHSFPFGFVIMPALPHSHTMTHTHTMPHTNTPQTRQSPEIPHPKYRNGA